MKMVWTSTTISKYLFKKAEGFIFKPIENNNNSTPISAGILRSPISSDIPSNVNIYPDNINPTRGGRDIIRNS